MYYQINIDRQHVDKNYLDYILCDYDQVGMEETNTHYVIYISSYKDKVQIMQSIEAKDPKAILSVSEKESENWMENWKKYFKPITLGKKFIIAPSWEKVDLFEERKWIKIDPKMAFGTGTHETTQLILETVETMDCRDKRVLDLGCGSGILAIATSLLTATDITAIDNDPLATENALENCELNQCKHIKVITGTLDDFSGQADIIMANINCHILTEIHDGLLNSLKQNAVLILSGILLIEKDRILKRFSDLDCKKIIDKGEWTCIVFKKN